MHSKRTVAVASSVLAAIAAVAWLGMANNQPTTRDGASPEPLLIDDPSTAHSAAVRPMLDFFPARRVEPPAPALSVEQWNDLKSRLAAVFPSCTTDDLFKLDYYCPADFDRDNRVDQGDLAFFVDVWSRGDGLTGHLADLNGDSHLDQQDINAYFEAYFSNDCDPVQKQTLRSQIC